MRVDLDYDTYQCDPSRPMSPTKDAQFRYSIPDFIKMDLIMTGPLISAVVGFAVQCTTTYRPPKCPTIRATSTCPTSLTDKIRPIIFDERLKRLSIDGITDEK